MDQARAHGSKGTPARRGTRRGERGARGQHPRARMRTNRRAVHLPFSCVQGGRFRLEPTHEPRRGSAEAIRHASGACDGGGNRAKRESARARHSASRAPVLPSPSPMHNPQWPGWLFLAHRISDHVRDGRSPLGWRRSEEKKWKRTCTAPPVPPMPSACHAVARSGAVFFPQRRFQPLSPPP
jgi:hypothetical protein